LTLRAHPEWSLRHLLKLTDDGGHRADLLGDLTIGDLMTEPEAVPLRLTNGEPLIDRRRLERAERARDGAFDDLLLAVLVEAGSWVGASYLRARLGGPRWKLQASLGRVVAAGKACRRGSTSTTQYRAAST
jgi:hypothetical protein